MKKMSMLVAFALSVTTAGAQSYYQDSKNPEMLRHADRHEPCRREVVLPQVNGYNVYKADLHTHSIFSDGSVMPSYRVEEAWLDGLDIMAVTEHIEYRPREAEYVEYLKKYVDEKYDKGVNCRIGSKGLTEDGIMVDLNHCVKLSQKEAAKYGILIIPGAEITRNGTNVGHFNALFTTDNNLIYDPDPVQAVRNAKAQGALVQHNHPGWTRKDINMTPTEEIVYGEGLVDGVEVMNVGEFYPGIIDRVQERGLFISANTDVHSTTAVGYTLYGSLRPMTLVFAKENTLEAVREALEADRTLALGFNTLCGEEQLLKDFFAAGVKVRVIRQTGKTVELAVTNTTSIPYTIRKGEANQQKLDAFSTIRLSVSKKAKTLDLTVLNMFCGKETHPTVKLQF
ncbi:MAG: histidinol-phosphatase [Bacteroidales bacterium]|nr:histidinol-phosphatase [Bacteroidales bacterium]